MTELVRGARKEDKRREMRDERIERRMKGEGGDMKQGLSCCNLLQD